MNDLVRRLGGAAAFDALTVPTVVLDPDLVIRAANDAYLQTVQRSAEQLLSVNLFDAFPANPDSGGDRDQVAASLERVLRLNRPDWLPTQRYDLIDLGASEVSGVAKYVRRHWSTMAAPIREQGRVTGILFRVDDITGLSDLAASALAKHRPRAAAEDGAPDLQGSMLVSVDEVNGMAEEIAQLREALTSRATIDQAKGILMVERRCGPDEAFGILRKMSNDSNVRVADVASALVYRSQKRVTGPSEQD